MPTTRRDRRIVRIAHLTDIHVTDPEVTKDVRAFLHHLGVGIAGLGLVDRLYLKRIKDDRTRKALRIGIPASVAVLGASVFAASGVFQVMQPLEWSNLITVNLALIIFVAIFLGLRWLVRRGVVEHEALKMEPSGIEAGKRM